ncbi:MAG TPA: hypothetical protein VF143_12390 [Candidatus Nanopelagicales bacterium]
MSAAVPAVPGVLTGQQVLDSARWIASVQRPSGAIAWFPGGHVDPWDHVHCAMGLSAAGLHEQALAAYAWMRGAQRPDGSWAIRYEDDAVVDPNVDANFCAYLATGVWHHWRVTADLGFVERMWPTVERGIDVAVALQRPDGAVRWARDQHGPAFDEAQVTGSASIHLSLRCALGLAALLGQERSDWELAAAALREALDHHPERFERKPHAMDWYYPVLGGSLPPADAVARLDAGWERFVRAGLGVLCVETNPWVTGAETCELVLALEAVGRREQAVRLFADLQFLREPDGGYWTGIEYTTGLHWPVERSTWTTATVILAADALSGATGGAGLFRGEGLPAARRLGARASTA